MIGWWRRWRERAACPHVTDWLQRYHGDMRNYLPNYWGWCRRCGKILKYREVPADLGGHQGRR